MLKVTGRVYVQETDEGLEGLHVKAVDKDLFFDDVLGTAATDKDGRFEITYEKKDFSELFEKAPDLYVIVRDPKSGRIVYSSEDSVRCEAGANESIDVAIPQSALRAGPGALTGPYGPESGTVKIDLGATTSLPEEVRLFFTEHRSEGRRQHQIVARTGKEVSVDLPSGEYTMQVHARGFETFRGLAEVDPKRPLAVKAVLNPRTRKASTFEERLAKYGIDAKTTEIGDLNVPPGTTLALNQRNDREKRGFKLLESNSIKQIKEWVGSDDARFGHDRPVYGPLPDRQLLARLSEGGAELRKLSPDEIKAVMAVSREYVQGNSKAVSQFEAVLNDAIRLTVSDSASRFPLFFYRVVTIGRGATLEVGHGSAIFTCDELRIHKTGKLVPVANVTIEIGTYTEFE
jgi:hypothetical protein